MRAREMHGWQTHVGSKMDSIDPLKVVRLNMEKPEGGWTATGGTGFRWGLAAKMGTKRIGLMNKDKKGLQQKG